MCLKHYGCGQITILHTLILSRSFASMTVPWKNSTCVKWRLNRPSNSKSGSFLKIKDDKSKINLQIVRLNYTWPQCVPFRFFQICPSLYYFIDYRKDHYSLSKQSWQLQEVNYLKAWNLREYRFFWQQYQAKLLNHSYWPVKRFKKNSIFWTLGERIICFTVVLYLFIMTSSTSTSSLSLCRKSAMKLDTDSYVMWPHSTICLKISRKAVSIEIYRNAMQRKSQCIDAFHLGNIFFYSYMKSKYQNTMFLCFGTISFFRASETWLTVLYRKILQSIAGQCPRDNDTESFESYWSDSGVSLPFL